MEALLARTQRLGREDLLRCVRQNAAQADGLAASIEDDAYVVANPCSGAIRPNDAVDQLVVTAQRGILTFPQNGLDIIRMDESPPDVGR
jgi:hypothetical protein